MRTLILTQWFFPEPDPKCLSLAKQLIENGHEVQVLTGFPNYPGGNLYKGYRMKVFQREFIDGVEVLRVPLYPSHDRSALKRMLNYLSFAVTAAALGAFLVRKADIMYVYHPPATIAIPALFIKLIRRIPVIYDVQDLWPDALIATGMLDNDRVLGLIDIYCKLVYKVVDRIVVLSAGFRSRLVDRGVQSSKIRVIYNWSGDFDIPDSEDLALKARIGSGKFTVLFAGNMGKAQALDSVMRAAEILQKKSADVQFTFVGSGVELDNLKRIKESLGLDNVTFFGRVPFSEIGRILKCADVLLVHLRKDPLFEITIPSKTQAYLRVGKPILMGVEGNAASLIAESGAGVLCESENAEDIAAKVLQLSEMSQEELCKMGANGRAYYKTKLSIEAGAQKFMSLFDEVLTSPKFSQEREGQHEV